MLKFQYILALCSLCQAAYISRMTTVNRLRQPTVFRPGVTLQRPWNLPRLVPAASHRAPYVLYKNPPHRYAVKHYPPPRNTFNVWKTTARLPHQSPSTPEYEFLRAASSPPVLHTNGGTYSSGAIHTIPAPNLSLSEKPIVVIDTSEKVANHLASEAPKPIYEVTEKYPETVYQMAKIEMPIGFSKATSLTTPELQNLLNNGAAIQIAPEYGLSHINVPQTPHNVPQQYAVQAYHEIPTQQELINSGAEGIVIPPNALYQSDPMFLQKLQTQLLQRFPAVEFIPYAADVPSIQVPSSPQEHQLFLLENDNLKQQPSSFVPSVHKNVVQRETQEGSIITLVPETFGGNNATEKTVTTSQEPHNTTLELIAAESQPVTTTIKHVIESDTEKQNTTPIYYAQVGQSVGNVLANGFYAAINDVRAAAAVAQVEHAQETTKAEVENVTTTTVPDLKAYYVQNQDAINNQTAKELKPVLGAPFAKPADSVNVAYTLLRTEEKEPALTKEGTVYAGQIVEATISEDQDFNKEKATFMSRRAPIRLFAVSEDNIPAAASSTAPKQPAVKAKIPPKSKLMYDDKTGEPVLRIYASYLDSPAQREIIASRLSSLKHVKEATTRKEIVDNWKASTVKSVDKTQGFDGNQVTQFGLKLKARSDDYIPLFQEYDE